MQFITGLFGGSGNSVLTMLFALGAVLVLIVLAVWLLKLIFNASGNVARGRNRRLSVVDTLALDQKRQLLIVRRDNVEHLILTGGPQDLVVESGIAVAEQVPAQPAGRRAMPPLPKRNAEPAMPAPAAPAAPVVTAAPGTLLEQLQQAGHSGDRKARVSLRHTGLLRPVSGQNSDISAEPGADSAKEGETRGVSEGAALDHDTSKEANRS
ncbi:MAG: hypothetical protein ABS75_21365 [Pelagibacterium sp. SCN 63-23]|nr:MAG: hypothetical protein ABS75_21365 [Pelagibacterium sp. SCN 63-23]